MKTLAPVILFAVACHYVFVAAMSSKVSGVQTAALIAMVLVGAVFLAACLPEDKP